MSKIINCEIVGMKNNKGKSKGFKYLQQEVKRKQKAEEIVKAIQKIQNAPIKKNFQKQFKPKHFKSYANSDRNIKEDLECYEQANEDVSKELNYDYSDYHELWSNIKINLNHDIEEHQREPEYDLDQSNVKEFPIQPSEDIQDKYSDLDEYERRNVTNIDDYVSESLPEEDDIDEFLQPIIPKHIELQAKINILEEKLALAQESIYQLLGGLFNHDTQKNVLNAYAEILYTGKADYDGELEDNQFPTTRQGDENERRIQQLEENIDILVKRLKKGKPLHRFYRKFQKK
jgi:hypothetical protein